MLGTRDFCQCDSSFHRLVANLSVVQELSQDCSPLATGDGPTAKRNPFATPKRRAPSNSVSTLGVRSGATRPTVPVLSSSPPEFLQRSNPIWLTADSAFCS